VKFKIIINKLINYFYPIHRTILLLIILPYFPLFSQYASFDLTRSHASTVGLGSLGTGLDESGSALYSNRAFLASRQSSIVDFGTGISYSGNHPSSFRPGSGGFYLPYSETMGFGVAMKQVYGKNFPASQKSMFFTSNVFFATKVVSNLYASAGIGLGMNFRGSENSRAKPTGSISFAWKGESYSIGANFEIPASGEFHYYRGSDHLKETPPPYLSIGYTQKLASGNFFYLEINRIFYEFSRFNLNGKDARPKFDKGLGSEFQMSGGFSFRLDPESKFQLRVGLERGGEYNTKGRNYKSIGSCAGLIYYVSEASYLSVGLKNYGFFSKVGGRINENMLYFSATIAY
jgi:hypothetical protein